jgi:LysR family transcriptional activator of dmlA
MTQAVADVRTEPRGLLPISTGFRLGRNHVAPAISELAKRFPSLQVRLELVDRPVDLIAEGCRILGAAPAYLARHGSPQTLADLAQHACLAIRERNQGFGV